MKKSFVFILMALSIKLIAQDSEQKSVKTIYLNFENREYIEFPKKLKAGECYNLKIQNINLNNYYVKIDGKDIVTTEKLATPTFPKIDLTSLSNFVASFSPAPQDNVTVTKSMMHIRDVMNKLNGGLVTIKADLIRDGDDIETIIETYIEDANIIIKKNQTDLKSLVENTQNILNLAENMRLDFLLNNRSDVDLDFNNVQSNFTSFRQSNTKIASDLSALKTVITAYLELDDVKSYLKTNPIQQKSISEVLAQVDALLAKSKEFATKVNEESLFTLAKSVAYLVKSTEYVSFPIEHKGDKSDITVTFTPKDPKLGLQTYVCGPFSIPEDKTSYWSVGGSLFTTGFQQPLYYIEKIPPVSPDTIPTFKISDDGITNEFGFATTLKVGRKLESCSWFGYHANLGAGVTIGTSNVRPRVLTGVGLTFGHKHNLSIDGGVVFGYRARYASFATDNNDNLIERDDYLTPPTILVDELKSSYFLSLGYTFIK